ncbi:MAG: hypothetical protein A2Z57_04435 [Planctomycetes bacterium RIFCSPHIGHO2_12_39_6]|nr:MAG: hypothetical protein A2Z57_04435 [Planctomycetes bacterium RIFCSPHIGHO2_12_39_6]
MPLYKDGVRLPAEELTKINKSVTFELTEQYRAPKGRVKDHLKKNRDQVAKQLTIPTVFSKYDSVKKDVVQYQYANSVQQKEVGGKMMNVYSPHKLFFINGKLIVGPQQPDLYTYLLLNPSLEGNGNRPKFRKIDLSERALSELAKEQALFEAKKIILDKEQGWAYDKLVRIAVNFGANTEGMDEAMVKNFLMTKASENTTSFRDMCVNPFVDMKYLIGQNKNKAFIAFNEGNREWTWSTAMGTNNGMLIANTPSGMDPVGWFMEYLSRAKNNTLLEQLKNNIDFTEKINEPVVMPVVEAPVIFNGKVKTSEYLELEKEYIALKGSRKGIGIYNTADKLRKGVAKLKAAVPV